MRKALISALVKQLQAQAQAEAPATSPLLEVAQQILPPAHLLAILLGDTPANVQPAADAGAWGCRPLPCPTITLFMHFQGLLTQSSTYSRHGCVAD